MDASLLLSRAKAMRRGATPAERRLWSLVRNGRLSGYKFRRQYPLGPYIVDFICISKRLVVEADGGQHMEDAHYDAARSKWLALRGYRVVRFWNNEVLTQTEAVAERLLQELKRQG